jgi:uncharacterized protein YjbI with pentapeptide repeats
LNSNAHLIDRKMPTSAAPPPAPPPASDAAVSDAPARAAAWIEKLQRAVEAASAEARSAFFYYAGFGLYFTLAVAGTTHEDLLRGSTVTMPGLGIGMPIEGFYLFVPLLFVVFHVYALLQLVILARRIGALKLALKSRRGSSTASGQQVLLSPFAISQRLFGEPRGLVPRTVLCVSIWLTLVLIPLAVLIATQIRFLPYHAESVTWAHRVYIAVEVVLLLLLWPAIIHPRGRSAIERLRGAASRAGRWRRSAVAQAPALFEIARRRLLRQWRSGWSGGEPLRGGFRMVGAGLRLGLVALVLFMAFVVATIPGEAIERVLLGAGADDGRAACSSLWRIGDWLRPVRLPDRRDVLCVTYGIFEAPETPLGLRRNIVARDANLVVSEPTDELIRELGPKEAWQRKGKGVDLQGRDLRFADLSGSDLRRADLRGANLNGAVLQDAKLTASSAGDIPRSEVGACAYELADDHCLTGLVGADLKGADLRYFQGWKADFREANLTAAALQEAALGQGRFDGALLVWAHLDGADLRNAQLTGAVLREAIAPEALLDGADLRYAFLRKADLAGAELTNAKLDNADLGGTELDDRVHPTGDGGYQTRLTFRLFRRACEEGADSVHGVVARLWHELDYSASHDRPGYAGIAGLRYLLAKLILSPTACPGAEDIDDRDVCRLHDFLTRWTAARADDAKPFEPELQRSWNDLRELISAEAKHPARWSAEPHADQRVVTDIWEEFDAQLAYERPCPYS